MRFYNGTDKTYNVYFLLEHHVDLLRSKGIRFADIENLLFYPDVSEEDALDLISFQRSVEKFCFPDESYTTYSITGDIRHTKLSHDKDVITQKLKNLYNENKSYELNSFNGWFFDNDTFVILLSDKPINKSGFQPGLKKPVKTLYHALLTTLGYQALYHRGKTGNGSETGINLAKLIANCLR